MGNKASIRLGNFLYKNLFGIYNLIYPVFKRMQDKEEIKLMREYIRSGAVVLDIGANIGFYTRIFSSWAGPGGLVYAFEPDQENFSHLRKNTSSLKNIVLVPKAVSDRTGKIEIYKSPMLNVDHRTYPVEGFEHSEIESVKLDEFLASVEKVDFIKMDIQGYESFALKGMQSLLQKNHDVKLLLEFWPFGLKKANSSVKEYFSILSQLQFKAYLLDGGKRELIDLADFSRFESLPEEKYLNLLVTRN